MMVLAACSNVGKLDRSKVPAPGPAPAIQIGQYQTFELSNGLKVIVVENHKLPRVSYRITLDTDPVLEGSKAGYVAMAGDLMRNGTSNRTKSQIDETIDFIGADLSTSATTVGGSCLSKHSSELLDVMSDVLLNPSFPEAEIEKYRKQTLSGLASQKTDPNAISGIIGNLVKYGKNHPYGESETEESVKAIVRDDLVNYYNSTFKPNVAYLTIIGDITPEVAKAHAEKYFGGWKRGNVNAVNHKTPSAPVANEVVFVPVPGAVQSVIDITYAIDLKPGTQEAITAGVLNNVLGGSGFQARLMQNLREDKAYTYGAYSSISSDEFVGEFSAGASVRNEVTDSSVTEFLFEMDRLTKELVADSTLQIVKNIMTGSFARSLESPQTIANFALNIERYKLPKDYYQTYLQKLNAVTAEDLLAAAKRYIKPSNCYITVVGNKDVAASLDKFAASGKVTMLNPDGTPYTDLEPMPSGMTPQIILNNYISGIGGTERLGKITSFEQTGSMSVQGMSLGMTLKGKGNKKFSMSVTMAGTELQKVIFDGEKAAMMAMGQKQEMEGAELLQAKMQADMMAELHYTEYGITPEAKGIATLNGNKYYVLELKDKDGKTTSTDYFDVKTGLRYKSVSVSEADGQSMTSETIIEEYLTVDGIKVPGKVKQIAGGQNIDMTTTTVVWNGKIDDAEFVIK
ncbi:MAG: hypothetical protein RL220_1642 [Bacteroidota bacterium]